MNTALLAANCAGTGPLSSTHLYALNKNWEPSPPAHLLKLYRIPSGPGAGNCVETEHRLLGTPGAKTKSAFRQSVVFFRLCPRKTAHCRFSFSNSFSREARYNLAQSMKVNALEGAMVEAFSDQ